jgi:uncharacterized metal-binding protein YceD (DUF177 family)
MKPREPQPEFSRPIDVARVPKLGSTEKIAADLQERVALAKRLQVPAVHGVSAVLLIKPWRGGGMKVSGQAEIDLDQISVVSLDQFRTQQSVDIERYFMNLPAGDADDPDLDIEPLPHGEIDIGEIVAETIALELDPYPRKPGEEFSSTAIEPEDEVPEKPNPFNVLKLVPRGD